jgi:recombination protein RecA
MVERKKREKRVKEKKSLSEQVEESANAPVKKREPLDTSLLVPSGVTLLNCACSDNPFGAFVLGRIITLPGSSAGGKTMLALTMLASCANDKKFDDYDLIYDDGEEALDMDIPYLFGNKLDQRLIAPAYDDEDYPIYSNTIQDFKANILNRCKKDTPFIYILDSLDSLTTNEELEKEYKQALAKEKDPNTRKEITGSYKTEKAKAIGEALRMINGRLKETKSLLVIVQQLRAKIGVTFGKKTGTSGGNAPFFYSHHQVWFSKISSIPKTVKGITRKIGNKTKIEVVKNKLTGKIRDIQVNIYEDLGIDDIESCIDFLVDSKHWKKKGQTIVCSDLKIEGTMKKVINLIEEDGLYKDLQTVVGKVWNEIETGMRLNRKRRFE